MAPKVEYRYTTLPRIWPGKVRPEHYRRPAGPFKVTTWSAVERALTRELAQVRARDVVLAVDMPNPGSWNMQGTPRADARAKSPAVIVSFTNDAGVRLTFPCDTYGDWITNVYAVAKTLENLRAIDRYGVTQGDQQYVGFKALPASGTPSMTAEQAADIIAGLSELPPHVLLQEPSVAKLAIRTAKRVSHPDYDGGSDEAFQSVTTAAAVLEQLHGESA